MDEVMRSQIARLERDARMAVGRAEREAMVGPAIVLYRQAMRCGEDVLAWRAHAVAESCRPLQDVA